ncbi:MAG: hypothetical protein OHK93_000745 [Ramalina farinacea]|uniref:Uncharacterized protein n=1 Tax=Ramalina farinacea TaxID=258253 RepID=A0AA43QFI0_9LECA|nr:hypothetical protein [Ramalina farinacea]
MKQTIAFRIVIAFTATWTAHSRNVPQRPRFDHDDEPMLDHLERDVPEDFLEPASLDKRRTPLSQYVNWHASLPWDNLASGGSPDDLLGQYSFQSGLSTVAWTAWYEGFDLPFFFNITTDFGFCKQSIVTGTDIGVYNYVNGTISDSTTMKDVAFDIIPLLTLNNYTDTQKQTDHLIVQAQASYDGHKQALLQVANFCATTGQSTLTPGQSTDPPPNDTQKIGNVYNELRRKLLMYGGLEEIELAEQGQAPPLTTTTVTSTPTAAPVVETAVIPGVLPGPTRHGYNFYIAVGSPTSLVLGAAVAFVNQLAWKQGNMANVDWSAVTNTAAALLLGFILSAAILGRYLAFGSFNDAGAQAAVVARNPTDTLVRPVVRTTASGTRRTINTSREALSGFALIANLRRTLRQQGEILNELEQNYQEHRLQGRPSSDPLGVNDLRQAGFSTPSLPVLTGSSNAGEGASAAAAASIPGSSNDQGVCTLEQSSAALAAAFSFMQGAHTYSWSDQEEDGLAEETGLHPASPDEEVVREDEGRDETGHCSKNQ